MEDSETILEIGACGGHLQICGKRLADGSWAFLATRNESTVLGMLPEEDREGLSATDQSGWVDSFEEALEHLDRYPWHKLYPLRVHPEFKDRIYEIVTKRYAGDIPGRRMNRDEWQYLCGKRAR